MLCRALVFLLFLTWETAAAIKLGAVREIGGSNIDSVAGMVRDPAGNLYITGKTYSVDFPATVGQARPGGSTLWRIDGGGAQLTPLFGHGNASVRAIAASGSTLYVFTGDALLKTNDNGTTFTSCDTSLPKEPNLGALALDGETVYIALSSSGIFKSTDGCRTFHASFQGIASNTPNQPYPDQIVLDPSRRSTLFASTHYLLFRSDDAGASWQPQTHLGRDLAFDTAHPGVLYANGLDANYRTADHGATWAALPKLAPGADIQSSLHVDLQGNLYTGDGNLYFSADGGMTWTRRQSFGNAFGYTIDPDTGTVYVIVGDGIFASNDGFVTYQTVEYYQIGQLYTLAAARGTLYTGNLTPTADAFVAKLDPAGNTIWSSYLGGPYEDYATGIAVAPNGDVVVSGFQVSGGSLLARFTNDGALLYSKRWTDANTIPYGIATDSSGNAYLTGRTTTPYIGSFSGTLPVTPGAAQTTIIPSAGHAPEPTLPIGLFQPYDAFACKFAPDGTIVYCTYLGEGFHNGSTISVDADGNAYVAGGTRIWKVNPDGSTIVYTQSLLGGNITAGTLMGDGSWWVGGSTLFSEFTTTPGAFQRVLHQRPFLNIAGVLNGNTDGDGFVTRLDAATGDIAASTFLGGEAADTVTSIAVGKDGNVTVAGRTLSRTFPLRDAFQSSFAQYTAFVSRLTPDLSTLIFSTYAGDRRSFAAFGVALGDDGSVWVAGDTAYPWVVGPGANPSADVFVTQLIPESSAPPDVSAVLNSASLQGTTIAPNQIITVVASGAGSDATLLVNGAALPTISSQNGMIVAQVPADFQAPASVNVGVQSGGRTSAPLVMPGDVAAPAIYTQDGSGTGLGLIFNEDGSLNSADNPATQGSVVSIACNGVGVDSPVHVYVDGALGDLLGATSQALPGLPGNAVILRVRIPTAFSMPPLVSVLLNVGGVGNVSGILSQPYVAIAITSTPR